MVDVLEAYRCLFELKSSGRVRYVGVGAKDAKVIELIANHVKLDWAMIACSLTVHSHAVSVINLIHNLAEAGVYVLNSAVFNSGFLVGGDYYNYLRVTDVTSPDLFVWRDTFMNVLRSHGAEADTVCIQFSFLFYPSVQSVVLNATTTDMVLRNQLNVFEKEISPQVLIDLTHSGMIHISTLSAKNKIIGN
jgi:D-threo-aldose 1-dehydrogenase